MSKKAVFAFCALAIPLFAFGSVCDGVKERMIRDLDFIRNTFDVKYAPADWKKRYAQWDLAEEIDVAKARVQACDDLTVKNFQRIVKYFFNSTKDYHVGVSFWSTEWAALPFRVCGANDKFFISYIDRARLPARSFPFQIGDELVMFDGRPTGDVVRELREVEIGNASPDTDQGLAEILLTKRTGSSGMNVPHGPVTITVKSVKANTTSSYQIIWDYAPEKIRELAFKHFNFEGFHHPRKVCEHKFFNKQMVMPFAKDLSPEADGCLDPNEMGARKSFVPQLGKLLWQNDESDPFYAYIFESPSKKKIGYVRIPNYSGGAYEVESFARVIAYLEKNTSALVIDQVNNPGGSVYYLYALTSLLTDGPLHTPKHRMTITQEDVAFALEYEQLFANIRSDDDARSVLGDSMHGYPVTYQTSQFMLNFFRFIVDEWNSGRTLTKPYYLYGVDSINHHPETRYTKPIIVLVNRLCFSGGDFFPAILQDNKRVTLFGSKTAGAGGYVDSFFYANPFGIAHVHYTGSIAERIDNNPIENLGVTPDIYYDVTENDLQTNYSGYVQTLLEAVDAL